MHSSNNLNIFRAVPFYSADEKLPLEAWWTQDTAEFQQVSGEYQSETTCRKRSMSTDNTTLNSFEGYAISNETESSFL